MPPQMQLKFHSSLKSQDQRLTLIHSHFDTQEKLKMFCMFQQRYDFPVTAAVDSIKS